MELRFISCNTNEQNENLVQRSAGLRPRIVAWIFVSSFHLSVSVSLVAVTAETLTESTQTSVPARPEAVREEPLPVEGAVAGKLVLVAILIVLLSVCARDVGTQVATMSIMIVEAICHVIRCVIPIIADLSIRVEVLENVGQLLQVVLPQVRVPEGGAQCADVGGPGGQLAAVGINAEHVDGGRGGDTRAGRVARCREAWRGAR